MYQNAEHTVLRLDVPGMIDLLREDKMEQSIRDVAEVTQSNEEEQILAIPGARRDLTLVSAAHAVIHAVAVLMPLIYPFIQKEYNLSYTQIGLIVAIPNAVGGFLQIVFGLLSRYILRKVMLGVGSILVGTSKPLLLQP
jgi:hypothetical protein